MSLDMARRLFPFQSTPLREGRLTYGKLDLLIHVSIHAPARGATKAICNHIKAN